MFAKMEMNARLEMVRRLKQEEINLKQLPETEVDQKNAKLTAIAETETTLQQLQANPPIGQGRRAHSVRSEQLETARRTCPSAMEMSC